MKNPFRRSKRSQAEAIEASAEPMISEPEQSEPPEEIAPEEIAPPQDSFTEWCRSQIRGGIERRERNDIFEAYSVYGEEGGKLTCRYYHRYPEHEREFDLSYTRVLSFDDFNHRLLGELDKGDLKLDAYDLCIKKAAELSAESASEMPAYLGFSASEVIALHDFCDGIDTLKGQSYLNANGVLCCECESVVGDERLNIRFRKPLPYDAFSAEIAGVKKEEIGGYDIDNVWVMSVYNRLSEKCRACKVARLTSEWSLDHERVYLISAEGFPAIDGALYVAVAEADHFRRFGFYSLDFSGK